MNGSRANHDFLAASADAIDEKSSLDFFQNGAGGHGLSDCRRSPMIHVDRGAHGCFTVFAKRLLCTPTRVLHPRDHPGRGKNGRKLRIVRRKRVLVLDHECDFESSTQRDVFRHIALEQRSTIRKRNGTCNQRRQIRDFRHLTSKFHRFQRAYQPLSTRFRRTCVNRVDGVSPILTLCKCASGKL